MKTISVALAAHFGLSCTTLAVLWKVKRQDGTILGFTNHDVDITYNDGADTVAYKALTGYTPSAVESGSDFGTDNLQATAFLDSIAITEADLRAGVYNYADIEIRAVNYNDLTMGDCKIRKGTLGQVKIQNQEFISEIRGLTFWLTTMLGQTYGPGCRADLGDAKCQVDLSMLRQTGSVATVTDNETFVPTSGLSPAGAAYFNYGIVTWTSGANNGYQMEISNWDGTTAILFESMPNDIQIGDTFTIEPGCNKGTDCNTKFIGVKLLDGSTTGSGGNILNKRSEDFIPGMDSILQYPNAIH
jgi:uncharacterized phage protein (TIGR02218 family)